MPRQPIPVPCSPFLPAAMSPTYPAFPFLNTPPRPLPLARGLAGPPRPGAPGATADDPAGYQHLQELLALAPVAMCLLRGPAQVIDMVTALAAASWGRPAGQLGGKPFFEALPDLRGQGYEGAFATVWQTQQGVQWREAPLARQHPSGGQVVLGYFDVSFQPFHDEAGHLTGILLTSHDVTEQVLARQRVHQAAEELAATNAGLADYVAELTHAAHAAQHYAEGQAGLLAQLLEHAPLAIGLLVGPDYLVDVCNAGLRALWGRTLAQVHHQPLFEVLPELQGQGLRELLDEVGRTGRPAAAAQPPGPGQPTASPVTLAYYPLRDAQGHAIALAAVATAGRAPGPTGQ